MTSFIRLIVLASIAISCSQLVAGESCIFDKLCPEGTVCREDEKGVAFCLKLPRRIQGNYDQYGFCNDHFDCRPNEECRYFGGYFPDGRYKSYCVSKNAQ